MTTPVPPRRSSTPGDRSRPGSPFRSSPSRRLGVTVGGLSGLGSALTDTVAVAVMVALVVGKTVGVFVATWGVARFTHAELDDDLAWVDVFGLAILSGIGFTVSLLITELAFDEGSSELDHAKVAVLCGSLLAALLASVVLRLRNRVYKQIRAAEAGGRGPRPGP